MSTAPATAGARAALAPLSAERQRARRRAAWRRRRTVLLFMSPWIVGFSVFFAYPLIDNAYLSFTHYDLLSSPHWIGLANYRYLFSGDQEVWPAVSNTLWFLGIAVPLQVLFAFGVAIMLTRARRGRRDLPDDLLPAHAGADRRRDAGLRVPVQPGHRSGQFAALSTRHHRPPVVSIRPLGQAIPDPAQPVGDRQCDGHLPGRHPRRPQASARGGPARRCRGAADASGT